MHKPQQRITEEELRALLGPFPQASEPVQYIAQPAPEQIIMAPSPDWAGAQLARVWTDLLH